MRSKNLRLVLKAMSISAASLRRCEGSYGETRVVGKGSQLAALRRWVYGVVVVVAWLVLE